MATKTEKVEFSNYKGQKMLFYPNSHRYKLVLEDPEADSSLLSPSGVAGVIDKSQALLIWNDNLIKEYISDKLLQDSYSKEDLQREVMSMLELRKTKLEEAQNIGTALHKYAEACAWAKTCGQPQPELPTDIPPEVYNAFISLELQHELDYYDSERFIFSDNYGAKYSGQLDVMLKIDGISCLADWKTSKRIYPTHKIQLAGYDLAMIEECEYKGIPLPYEKLAIVHLSKETGDFEIHYLTEEERLEYQTMFKNALMLKKLLKKYDKWEK